MDRTAATRLEEGWRLCCIGQPRAALSLTLVVYQDAQAAGLVDIVAEASCRIAWFCFQLGDIAVGIDHAIEARQLFQQLGSKSGECWATAIYAWLLHEGGTMDLAAQYANEAVAMAETLADDLIASWAFNVLAIVFWTCKQVDRALPWCERAIFLVRRLDHPHLLSWWLINLGGIQAEAGYLSAGRNDVSAQKVSMALALNANSEAMTIAEREGDLWALALTLCNAAEYHISVGESDHAEAMLARAQLYDDIGPRTTAQFFYTKAQWLSSQGAAQDALKFSQDALDLARAISNKDYEAHALRYLSEAHESLQQYRQALEYLKEFRKVRSRLDDEKVRMRARITEAHYRTEYFKTIADEASRRAESFAAMNVVDALTGVGNRRALDQALVALRESQVPYGLAIIDLDHFKHINDTFTHAVGDDVLRRMGTMLLTFVRQSDSAIRMGGEEFVLIFANVTVDVTMSICARLQTCIRSAPWSDLHERLRVTASIGVAAGHEAPDPTAVLALADKRLYAAKHAGRDCVVGSIDTFVGSESQAA